MKYLATWFSSAITNRLLNTQAMQSESPWYQAPHKHISKIYKCRRFCCHNISVSRKKKPNPILQLNHNMEISAKVSWMVRITFRWAWNRLLVQTTPGFHVILTSMNFSFTQLTSTELSGISCSATTRWIWPIGGFWISCHQTRNISV